MSADFTEKLVLLLTTAVLTGFLVPYLLKQIDERKNRQQKETDERKLSAQKNHEAEINRQNKVIDSQGQLLENIIQLLWEFQLLALALPYYRHHKDKGKYSEYLQKYDEKSWAYFTAVRIEISKAKRLTSEQTYETLLNFYHENMMKLDAALMGLVRNDKTTDEDWNNFHKLLQQSAAQTDDIVTLMAREMRLARTSAFNAELTA